MQPLFDESETTGSNVVSPALEKRGIQNEGGFLTPYYMYELLERQHGEELDPAGRDAAHQHLRHVFQQVQRALTATVDTSITLERSWSLWYKELFQTLGFTALHRLSEPLDTSRHGLVPISHAYDLDDAPSEENPLVLVDLHPFGTDLDRQRHPNPLRYDGMTTEPISRAIELTLDSQQAKWALLSNGLELRLYRRGSTVARQYLKVDFVTLFSQDNRKDWLIFWGLFRLAAFLPKATTTAVSSDALYSSRCLLEEVIEKSQRHATKIADDLRENIVAAAEYLLQGVIDTSANRRHWKGMLDGRPVPDEKQLKGLFEESVYFLYRLLFILYAESRDLLPIGTSVIYRDGYSFEHLREMAEKPLRQEDYEKTYYSETLHTLFAMLYRGYPSRNPAAHKDEEETHAKETMVFRIPPYNGRLFDPARTPLLSQCHIPDRAMREVIRELSLSRPKKRQERRERYSYADLGIDQLGSIYEGLLVYEPSIAQETLVEATLKGEVRLIPLAQADEYHIAYDEETLKPAGSFVLRIWGGRRKGSGSYYTPHEITAFLVKESLAPLVEPIIEGCGQRDERGRPLRHAEEILQLKVCDPAMGSGAFLVQACRYLGDAYGRAIIAEEGREEIRLGTQELARYKRRIAETCLYGVDLNPLAVELAKVSLWLETLAQDRPLTFLDAHLRCGNALIGAPLRNRNGQFDPSIISVLPTDAYISLTHVDSQEYVRRLSKRRTENSKQIELFRGGQQTLFTGEEERLALIEYERQRLQLEESDEDKSLEEAVDLVHYKQMLLEEALQGNESAIRRFKEVCNLWCAVWFWPLDADVLPPTSALYRDLAGVLLNRPTLYTPEDAEKYFQLAREIHDELRFFHWELEFPEIWCDAEGKLRPEGGFDAIIGNPPWSKLAPKSKEFWSNYLPLFTTLGKQAAVRAAEEVRSTNPKADLQWRKYLKHLKQQGELLKQKTLFAWQGKGQLNTYKLFVEKMLRLTRIQGIYSLVLPSGFYTDEGGTKLRELVFFQQQARFLFSTENRGGIFPIHSSMKVALLSGEKHHRVESPVEQAQDQIIHCLFLVGKAPDGHNLAPSPALLEQLLPQLEQYVLHVPSSLVKLLAPDTFSLMEFKNQREIDMVVSIYNTFPLMGTKRADSWNVSFSREVDMTNGSHLFREGTRLKLFGATPYAGRIWKTPSDEWYLEQADTYTRSERVVKNGTIYFPSELSPEQVKYRHTGYILQKEERQRQALPIVPDETYMPLYEGRMVHQFDHTAKAYIRGSGRSAEWRALGFEEKEILPHYFVAKRDCPDVDFRAGFCDVTGPTNERSMLAAMIPPFMPCGHTVSTVVTTPDDWRIHALWIALMNSFVVDWLLRFRVANHASFFLLESLAFPRPKLESEEAQCLIRATLRLTCFTPEFAPLWERMTGEAWQGTSGVRDVQERARLRAEIDAVVADLYGLSEHDYAYILSTFPLLDRDQPALPGEPASSITRDLALLTLLWRRGIAPPTDIVAFFKEAGVDLRRCTGSMLDLEERVRCAIEDAGAVAYVPSQRERDNEHSIDDIEEIEEDEEDFDL
jgi:hypothetical protein